MDKTTKPSVDRVDRARADVGRAIGPLVGLLGDEDQAVVEKAALALAEIGPYVVAPLAAALPRVPSPRHRAVIIGALLSFGAQAKGPVVEALIHALQHDKHPYVRWAAQMALDRLIESDLAAALAPRARSGAPAGDRTPGR